MKNFNFRSNSFVADKKTEKVGPTNILPAWGGGNFLSKMITHKYNCLRDTLIGEYIICLIILSAYSSKLHRKELIKKRKRHHCCLALHSCYGCTGRR